MEKFDLVGETCLSGILSVVFTIECARLFFAGKTGWIAFLPLAWIFGSWVYSNIKELRK